MTISNKSLVHAHTPRQEDRKVMRKYKDRFNQLSNKKLVEAYNALNGMYGVHRQALYVIALNQEFLKRFNKSPFETSKNHLIGLSSKIVYNESSENFVFS